MFLTMQRALHLGWTMMLRALLQALSMLHLYHMQLLLQAMEAIIMLRRSPRYWLWPLPLGARALAAAARRLLLSCQRRTPACLPAGSVQRKPRES